MTFTGVQTVLRHTRTLTSTQQSISLCWNSQLASTRLSKLSTFSTSKRGVVEGTSRARRFYTHSSCRRGPGIIALGVAGSVTLAAGAQGKKLIRISGVAVGQAQSFMLKSSSCAEMSKVQSFSEEDLPGWTEASRDLYNQYTARLVGEEGWKLLRTSVGRERNAGLFTLSHPEVGAVFEYALFFSEEEEKLVCIMQFGPKAEGPPGFVHGGAIATAADICAGVMLNTGMQVTSVTASLTTNYKRPIPLGSSVIIETKLDRVEGRKYFVTGTIKSPDELFQR
ncbi:acyl-coenzyme A thioesterase THEM4-like isoform X2 [Diadema setosum]|uniref:acyl-coenzyme A thioesterase THEM4-like isoform X2 n=1 Tax=Diadema setosum TaxID=31175 RepID=UPI003B3A50BA